MSGPPDFGKNGERRKRLWDAQGGCCWLCGLRMSLVKDAPDTKPNPAYATFDEILPKSRGGARVEKNQALAHRDCNSMRSSGIVTDAQAGRLRVWYGTMRERALANEVHTRKPHHDRIPPPRTRIREVRALSDLAPAKAQRVKQAREAQNAWERSEHDRIAKSFAADRTSTRVNAEIDAKREAELQRSAEAREHYDRITKQGRGTG